MHNLLSDRSDPKAGKRLLTAADPSPVFLTNADGRSPFLLIGDHAGNRIPQSLGTLGLSEEDRTRHIAWDIGVMALGELLSARLGAAFLAQRYSRLVIDCNRDPQSQEAIMASSDGTVISGNRGLDDAARRGRIADIHAPYQRAIADQIASRAVAGRPTILVALHSFTPSLAGVARPWHIGILHSDGRTDFALSLIAVLKMEAQLVVGDNEPYRMDATDLSIPLHAFPALLPYAEIEVRQDLLQDPQGRDHWSALLAETLMKAATEIGF